MENSKEYRLANLYNVAKSLYTPGTALAVNHSAPRAIMANVGICYLEKIREAVKLMHPESKVITRFRGPHAFDGAGFTRKSDATHFAVYLYSK